MAHRFTQRDEAARPEFGVDRKWLADGQTDAIVPKPTSATWVGVPLSHARTPHR